MRDREQKQDSKKSKIGKLKFKEQVKERIDSRTTRETREVIEPESRRAGQGELADCVQLLEIRHSPLAY